jgi:hypothetical protein
MEAAFGVGLCATTAALAPAQDYHYIPQGPVYVKPNCAPPGVPLAQPPLMQPVPGTTTAPPATATAPAPQGQAPGAEQAPAPAGAGAAEAAAAEAGAAEAGAGAEATASSAGMLGRGDANNRFNLFDNTSAIPTNRVWFTYENMQNFSTGFTISQHSAVGFTPTRTVNLYRVGAELVLAKPFSIAFEDQYIASPGADNAADAWGNPQIMLKWAFLLQDHQALAATLGIQPQVSSSAFELHETDTRFLPGLLYYGETENFYTLDGIQFGLSSSDLATTFDWAVGVGYWLYRAGCTEGNRPLLSGIALQAEVFGKHVMVGSTHNPFDTPTPSGVTNDFNTGFREGRNVIDVTVGGRVLLLDRISLNNGFSFPVTGADVRRTEYIANVTFLF